MNPNPYRLEIDFNSGEIHYSAHHGYSRSVKLDYQSLSQNSEFLNNFIGKDAYLIGIMHAAKSTDRLNVTIKEKQFKFYTLISILFASVMIISNILSTKLVNVFGFTIAGAMLIYPFSYIFDYILTDVYGYQNTRRTILSTILCLCMFDMSLYMLIILPPSPYWHYQAYVDAIFYRMLRTFVASTVVFSFAFFVSSYLFQKIKIKTEGKSLFKRVFYSLVISEVLETWLFCMLAFAGVWPLDQMARYMILSFFIKVTFELIVYGILTRPIIEFIKKIEKSDIIDWRTNFNPFSWRVDYDTSNNVYKSESKC